MKSLTETQNVESNKNWLQVVKGLIISYILTFILLFLFSLILTYTNVGENTIAPVIIVITVISILIGSSICGVKIRKNGIIYGGIMGLLYIFLLYMISSMIQTGFGLNVYAIIMMVLSVVAGMIGGIVGVNLKK